MSKNVIKISAEQLKKMISEEAIKYKKVLQLQKERNYILNQLKEVCEDEEFKKLSETEKEKTEPSAADGGEPKIEKPKTYSKEPGKGAN